MNPPMPPTPSVPTQVLEGLGRLPKEPQSQSHYWVDYIELMCLTGVDRRFSKADALDIFSEEQDIEQQADVDEDDEEHDDEDESAPAYKDRQVRRVDDLFRLLLSRAQLFGNSYPFYLDAGEVLAVRDGELTLEHKLYVFLLLCSSLGSVQVRSRQKFTGSFERLSAQALKSILPAGAEVHIFGTSRSEVSIFSGNLWNRLQQLAEHLHEEVRAPKQDFAPTDTGDHGVDIVAWVPFDDKDTAPGLLILFAQCACTSEWVTKQHSSSSEKWRPTISPAAPHSNMVFIPFCFRDVQGSWLRRVDISGCIPVDRLRFVHLLKNSLSHFEGEEVYAFVQAALLQRRSVV